ncbi:MAG: helix-hairpin-helix domain-containing protein [Candidatus Bathyarchaeota archaeon]|nr:helix-hairpin-helix domain-containing protein [Candidatus Bathyarchaeota archaeon]MDW8039939.1 ERCC4 domain-containing protein [Nitrososphaerota archaeon]
MFEQFKPTIFADVRESMDVKDYLREFGCEVVEKILAPADYVVAENYAVERKEIHDFFRSVFDGRLFEQAERLAETYESSCLVVEGDFVNAVKHVQTPQAFWGALAKVVAEHSISLVFTPNEAHTAMFLYALAKKLQGEEGRKIVVKHKPKTYTLRQRQLLAVQSLPKVGPERAEMLLKRFGSVRRVFQATKRELLSVKGLGEKTAQTITDFLDTKYPGLEEV